MKFAKYICLSLVCLFPLLGFSQQVDIQLPYFCGFEDPVENANWVLSNGVNVNQWIIGSAISREGQKSLYISLAPLPNGQTFAIFVLSTTQSCEKEMHNYKPMRHRR